VSVPGNLSGQTTKCHPLTEWSGINALIYYGPLLMRSLGFNGNTVNLLVAGGVNIVQFLAVLPAILYIDRLGGWLEWSLLSGYDFRLDRA
jgi:Sugar (and other) transporter